MPQSQACPHSSAMHQAAGIFLGGGHCCPFDPRPALPVPLAAVTLHPQGGRSAVCVQDAGPRWAVVPVVQVLGPGSHPAPVGGRATVAAPEAGLEAGVSLRGVSLPASSRKTLAGGAPALGAELALQADDQPWELRGEAERQSSSGRPRSSEPNWRRRAFCLGFFFFANLFRNLIPRSILF